MFDTAIIGTGPAGLSAAINLKIRGKNIIWFGSYEMSQKIEKSETIANYPGMGFISGRDLNGKLREHAAALGLEITDRMVTNISKLKDYYMLLADNEIFEAKTVLLATGVANTKGFPGEEKLLGRGVSYCATCDGMFYKGKTIAVYCQDRRFEEEVTYLAELAEKVYLFAPYPDCGIDLPNVEKVDGKIQSLEGENRLTGLFISGGSGAKSVSGQQMAGGQNTVPGMNTVYSQNAVFGQNFAPDQQPASSQNFASGRQPASGQKSTPDQQPASGRQPEHGQQPAPGRIAIDGLFCLRNAIAPATLLPKLDINGPHIVVDRDMATNFPGCYAAGDCTGTPYQIAKAVGEGNVAAHSILKYLSSASEEK